MSRTIFPIWVFVAVAFAIAAAAFVTAQFAQGAGIFVALAGSLAWSAYVARKGAIRRRGE